MSCSLKIQPHIRGHIASSNGRVDTVCAKAEQYQDHTQNACDAAAMMEAQVRKERERKKLELAKFKKRVRQRAVAWERTKQSQIAASATEIMASEQKIAEQAVKLDKIKVQKSVEVGQDIEDIRTVGTARDTTKSISHQSGVASASQLARNKLLSLRGSGSKANTGLVKNASVQFAPTVQYEPVKHLNDERLNSPDCTHGSKRATSVNSSQSKGETAKSINSKRFVNPGHLEQVNKKQAALQYLLFRRLYSDLEREQARQKHRQQTQAQRIEALKKHKEATRRLVEDEVNSFDSFCSVSTEATEDQEKAREWAELMILEERRQQLQRSRENERYVEALQARLKEKLKAKQCSIPPLCSCGTTIWDTNPFTCANNCPFYRNPKAYEKALSAQLQSLKL